MLLCELASIAVVGLCGVSIVFGREFLGFASGRTSTRIPLIGSGVIVAYWLTQARVATICFARKAGKVGHRWDHVAGVGIWISRYL